MRINKSLVFEFSMRNGSLIILLLCLIGPSNRLGAQTILQSEAVLKREPLSSQQGAAVYGKHLFLFSDKGICDIYDLDKNGYLGQMSYEKLDIKHCDTAAFGVYKIDEMDEFPVVYLSGSQVNKHDESGLIWVYRIIHTDNIWEMKLYQIIKTPVVNDVGSFPDALLANSEGSMWIMGWKTQLGKTLKDGSGAYLIFSKFKTPQLNDGILDKNGIRNITLSISDAITSFVVKDAHAVQQGICLRNKKVYVPYGFAGFGYQGIDIVSLDEGRIIRNINLMRTDIGEPEAIFFYKGDMYIADGASSIKRIVNYQENE